MPGYTIEALARKPLRWIGVVYKILAEQELRQELRRAKYNAIAQRIEKNEDLMRFDELATDAKPEKAMQPVQIAGLPGAVIRRNGKRI